MTSSNTQLSISSNDATKLARLEANYPAPDFSCTDVKGKTLALSDFRGKKILLSFHRNVGCPICNLRFHELEREADLFNEKELILISVYESTAQNMQKYLEGIAPYTIMIPDPEQRLYRKFRVERSSGKIFKGILKGAIGKAFKGVRLMDKSIAMDGNLNRIGADFLINRDGTIYAAHYGSYIGDNIQLAEINTFLSA